MINQSKITAKNGMVATSEPQAADAGLEILKKGGNAIDAAIAVAACLTVTEPTSNGIGGDNFAIVWMKDHLYGMNASGFAPKSLTHEAIVAKGFSEIPKYGVIPVTVPGAVKGWIALHQKFGKLPFYEVMKPAINLAENGFVLQKTIAKYWSIAANVYEKNLSKDTFNTWSDTFLMNGKVPQEGDIIKLKDHAKTLKDIALTKGETFYNGTIANQIDAFFCKHQGFLTKDDLSHYQVEWVTPIQTNYKGYDIFELPPNGQGLIALSALNIFESLDVNPNFECDYYHKSIESIKLAFSDGLAYISDPKTMTTSVESLLSKAYAKNRSKLILDEAMMPNKGRPMDYGTVYLATADQQGNMVSMIQSNYMGFGSGLVIPNTGIAMHNRGHNFSFDSKSENFIEPLKRPYHTIIPGFIMKDKMPLGPFGVMGGFMQPQGHFQVLTHMIDRKLNPQEALDAPRFQWIEDKKITCEMDFPQSLMLELSKKGHDIRVDLNTGSFGRGQIIIKDALKNLYFGGTEKRCDGKISYY